jgi:hypothetical protein
MTIVYVLAPDRSSAIADRMWMRTRPALRAVLGQCGVAAALHMINSTASDHLPCAKRTLYSDDHYYQYTDSRHIGWLLVHHYHSPCGC